MHKLANMEAKKWTGGISGKAEKQRILYTSRIERTREKKRQRESERERENEREREFGNEVIVFGG